MSQARRGLASVLALAALVVGGGLAASGCETPPEVPERKPGERADRLAQAFYRYVDVHYAARLASEQKVPGPSPAVRLQVREDLLRALRELGTDLPDAADDAAALKAAVHAVRETLVAHDYVFLPLGPSTDDADPGIALARVREREPARAQEFWGRRVEYKRVLYDRFLDDYPTWRARALHQDAAIYSPGRYAGSTVYIDFQVLARRASTLEPPLDVLGLKGLIAEVELRQAAYLLLARDVPRAAVADEAERRRAIVRLEERVLWTVVRYGDPDAALADVAGLAASCPRAELKEAAERVQALLPAGVRTLPSKASRAEALHKLAEDVWPRLGVGG